MYCVFILYVVFTSGQEETLSYGKNIQNNYFQKNPLSVVVMIFG
jgi:hypothetical protein